MRRNQSLSTASDRIPAKAMHHSMNALTVLHNTRICAYPYVMRTINYCHLYYNQFVVVVAVIILDAIIFTCVSITYWMMPHSLIKFLILFEWWLLTWYYIIEWMMECKRFHTYTQCTYMQHIPFNFRIELYESVEQWCEWKTKANSHTAAK